MFLLRAAISYFAFVCLAPFLCRFAKLRAPRADRFATWGDGVWPVPPPQKRIWMHGASAGDILALLPTARALQQREPDLHIFATAMTNSGHAMAQKVPDIFAASHFCPWDLPHVVARALDTVRPDVLVLEYTELWPNLLHAAAKRGIPVVLHNGRISKKNVRSYRLLFLFSGNLLKKLRLLLMRDVHEARRAQSLGALPQHVFITGNTKFDNVGGVPPTRILQKVRDACSFATDAPVWVAGSTHEGEEEQLLQLHKQLLQTLPQLRLLIAPRYPERAGKVLAMVHKLGLRGHLRSQPSEPPQDSDVVVLDTLGELQAAYTLGDIVFVGGSFVARGGQNILEPAACGRPVLFGPRMENFVDSVQVLLGRGGLQVDSYAQLGRMLRDLLADADRRLELGATAASQVSKVSGAAARNAKHIAELLRAPA